jgi:putative FmdB family regulatory protein
MPTYLYECSKHGEIEEFHSIKITLENCPKCQEEGLEPQKLKPLIAGGSGRGIVELVGQELVDKCKADAQKIKKEAAKNEQVYANLLGADKYQALQQRMDKQKRR